MHRRDCTTLLAQAQNEADGYARRWHFAYIVPANPLSMAAVIATGDYDERSAHAGNEGMVQQRGENNKKRTMWAKRARRDGEAGARWLTLAAAAP